MSLELDVSVAPMRVDADPSDRNIAMHTNTGATAQPSESMLASRRTASLVLVATWIAALCLGGCGKEDPGGPGPLPAPGAVATPTPTPAPSLTMVSFKGYVGDRLGYPLSGVSIDLVDGPQAGATALTDEKGNYAFTDPVGLPVTVRLKRDGYAEKKEIVRTPAGFWFFLDTLDRSYFNFEPGNYLLQLSLDPADATSWIPQAPCAGIPAEALTQRFNATVTQGTSAAQFTHRVTVSGEGLAFPAIFDVALGTHEAAVLWDTFVPIDKDLGNFRYLQIQGNDSGVQGPISSSGSTVSISTPLDLYYCQLSGPLRPANVCSQVPSSRIVDFHACTWKEAVMRFERQ